MKKILELLGEPITNFGQEAVVINILRHLDMEEAEIDCLGVYSCANDSFRELVTKKGGTFYTLELPYQWNPYGNNVYKPVLNFLKAHSYDLIHIHSCSIGAISALAAAAHRSGAKVIVHSHASGQGDSLKHKLFKTAAGLSMARHVDRYFACSKVAAEWKFLPKYVKQTKIIANGIDIALFRFDPEKRLAYRKKLGIADSAFLIGHVGRFNQEKNHSFLVNVFELIARKNPGAVLLLLGNGLEMEKIQQTVKEKNLTDRVIFAGNVQNVPDYLQAMDAFVFPSKYEGFGLAAFEAIASGLPVVASDQVPRDIDVAGTVTFLSLNEPPAVWADAILHLQGFRRKDQSAAIQAAGFDIQTVADEIKTIYKELLRD